MPRRTSTGIGGSTTHRIERHGKRERGVIRVREGKPWRGGLRLAFSPYRGLFAPRGCSLSKRDRGGDTVRGREQREKYALDSADGTEKDCVPTNVTELSPSDSLVMPGWALITSLIASLMKPSTIPAHYSSRDRCSRSQDERSVQQRARHRRGNCHVSAHVQPRAERNPQDFAVPIDGALGVNVSGGSPRLPGVEKPAGFPATGPIADILVTIVGVPQGGAQRRRGPHRKQATGQDEEPVGMHVSSVAQALGRDPIARPAQEIIRLARR